MNDTNKIIDPNSRMVSGPVNVIRLQGNIHGVPKVLYLFLDYHIEVDRQTQCENIFSQDVQKYFANNFYKLNNGTKMFDFFLEIFPTEIAESIRDNNTPEVDNKEMYIEEVVKLFKKLFQYDPKKNVVLVNNLIKRIRLHYLDIRDYYKNNIHDRTSSMVSIAKNFMANDSLTSSGLRNIIRLMKIMRAHLEDVVNILDSPINKTQRAKIIKTRNNDKLEMDTLQYLTRKIKEEYKYDDVKKIMNQLLNKSIRNFKATINDIDECIKLFTNYANLIDETKGILNKDNNTSYLYVYGLSNYTIRNMIVEIVNKVESLFDEKLIEFFARFTDIFFLRRFLDKDYITNAITYSGALHANMYVYVLVNFFDFKVTHISHSIISDTDKLTKEIKKRSLVEIQELILPQEFGQCSSMDHFPKEFL
uniref:Uncharacterized protein n=1 Tax=Borely moumouvirus TaxID=2712067 RepID=A0A6G6ABU1_9VIRU